MAIVFGSDERSLNDVQISSCHCHWGVSTVRGKNYLCQRESTDYLG